MKKYLFLFTFLLISQNIFAQDDFQALDKIIVYKIEPYELGEVRVITDEQIKNLPVQSVSEAIGYLGVDLQSRGPFGVQTDFSIKGSTFQQVLILINGMRINDSQTAHHNSDLPVNLEDVERIEVYPGNLNASFGMDSFAGTINIVTKKPEETKYTAQFSGGENATKMGSFSFGNRENNLSNQFSIERKESNGFQYDTDFKILTVSSHHIYDFDLGNIKLDLGYNEKEFGAYDFYTPAKGYPSKEWTKTEFVGASAELNYDKFTFLPKIYWRRHYDKFMLDKTMPDWYVNHHKTDTFTQQCSLRFPVSFLGVLTLGEETIQERINSTNLGKYTREHHSFYIQNEKRLFDHFLFSLGSRYDHFDEFNDFFSPLFLIRYEFPSAQLHLSASRSIRRPSFTELYYSDPVTQGNPNLSVEEAINYETGILCHFQDKHHLGLNFFARDEDDLIDWAKTNPTDTKWKVRNIGSAQVLGLDIYGKINLIRPDLFFRYTYINREIKDKGGYLPKYGPISLKHFLNIGFDFDFLSGKQRINFFFKKRPTRRGWLLTDLRLSTTIKEIEVFLDANNILNEEYEEIKGIPSPGRWVQAGLRVQW
ncbi:MAG: TonB-dependent receptor [Candidatus Omnitrophota bacterium]